LIVVRHICPREYRFCFGASVATTFVDSDHDELLEEGNTSSSSCRYQAAEVCPPSASKAEPNLTVVRITSASKPKGVRRLDAPTSCTYAAGIRVAVGSNNLRWNQRNFFHCLTLNFTARTTQLSVYSVDVLCVASKCLLTVDGVYPATHNRVEYRHSGGRQPPHISDWQEIEHTILPSRMSYSSSETMSNTRSSEYPVNRFAACNYVRATL